MDDYLIDREILEKLVDGLFAKKSPEVNNAEEASSLREQKIKELDDRISSALFDSLTPEQDAKLQQLLENPEESPESFANFYKEAGIDPEKIMTETVESFSNEYLGGQNE